LLPLVYNLPASLAGTRFKLDSDIFSLAIHSGLAQRTDDYQKSAYQAKELAEARLRAVAVVPLIVRGRIIGILWIAVLRSRRVFSDYDMVLLESIGAQAAVALDNINLFEEQRFISEALQRGFLPERLPKPKHTDIGVFYASATIAAVVGGDFYDAALAGDDRMSLFVGDVSGKGVEATSFAAMVKYTLRATSFENPDPPHVLSASNAIISKQLPVGHFITLVYGLYDADSGRLLIGIAGHPHPLLYSASGRSVTPIEVEDPAFTLIENYDYSKTQVDLSAGDTLVLYTDGIIELRRDSEFFGEKRLGELIAKYAQFGAQEIADRIIEDAKEFASGRLTDDIVLMVIKRT